MRPPRLEHASEHLDEPVHDPAELEASLDHVAAVNRWLGGRRAFLRAIEPLLPRERPATVLDVGTGSADLPRALIDHVTKRRDAETRRILPVSPTQRNTASPATSLDRDTRPGHRARTATRAPGHGQRPSHVVTCIALDRHAQIVEIARRRCATYPSIHVVRGDALNLPLADRAVDVAGLSLTLHHFDGDDQVRALRELARTARCGVVVNELERSWPSYLGARLLASTVWRRNRLTRHDGPVSVLRAFAPAELLALARDAGLREARVRRFSPWRIVLVGRFA